MSATTVDDLIADLEGALARKKAQQECAGHEYGIRPVEGKPGWVCVLCGHVAPPVAEDDDWVCGNGHTNSSRHQLCWADCDRSIYDEDTIL